MSTVTITLTDRQADYVRELLSEDLKEWADALKDMAWEASETQGRATAAADAEEFCRASVIREGGRPTMAVLDLVGWHRAGACGRSPRPKDTEQGARGLTD